MAWITKLSVTVPKSTTLIFEVVQMDIWTWYYWMMYSLVINLSDIPEYCHMMKLDLKLNFIFFKISFFVFICNSITLELIKKEFFLDILCTKPIFIFVLISHVSIKRRNIINDSHLFKKRLNFFLKYYTRKRCSILWK